MRALWQGLVRIVFWSYERGTWRYDIAVAVIVIFVLLSPRSWFNDQPAAVTIPITIPLVEMRGADPADGTETYRVDARLIASSGSASANLQQKLHDALRKNAAHLPSGADFDIVRVAPVRGVNGEIAYYDVGIQPQE
jgi:hypothetical protein